MPTDIEIAREATLKPIAEVAAAAGIPAEAVIPFGRSKAKLDVAHLPQQKSGKLILVTAINPTPAGEGKTTTSIGLSVSSSRYCSVWTSMCFRPSAGSGVSGFGGSFARDRLADCCICALRSISSCSA